MQSKDGPMRELTQDCFGRPLGLTHTVAPPHFANQGKLTQAQLKGLRYQARVGKQLQKLADELGWTLWDGPWVLDANNIPCQPDFVLQSPSNCLIIFECKLTETDCTAQFAKYRAALSPKATCVQLCKRLRNRPNFSDLLSLTNGTMLMWT